MKVPAPHSAPNFPQACPPAVLSRADSVTPHTAACRVLCPRDSPAGTLQRALPFPSPGDLPDPGIKPESPTSPALQADSLLLSHQGSPKHALSLPQIPMSATPGSQHPRHLLSPGANDTRTQARWGQQLSMPPPCSPLQGAPSALPVPSSGEPRGSQSSRHWARLPVSR